uniref:Uncharacterized protein n=1 Tax=Arundo donax TaxID=35708 RepID=A0A0A9DCP0_ARUDO
MHSLGHRCTGHKKTGTQKDSAISPILSRHLQFHKNPGHQSSHQFLILFQQPQGRVLLPLWA